MKIVIVGGVAGGASAAARARRLDENAQIVVFERDHFISFANCGLPYHIGGEIADRNKLLVQTPQSMKARFNLDIHVDTNVERIDKENKTVWVKNLKTGKQYSETYDKLVLSPGAKPFIPPIKGVELNSVYSLRNIPDMDKIIQRINDVQPRSALIIGGGFIGLEMAEAMIQKGIGTTLVELGNQVMNPVDQEIATPLHLELKKQGVRLMLENAVTSIEQANTNSPNDELLVTLSNNKQLHVEMVILAIGITPETSLAKQCGLALGKTGAIKVDKFLQTSDENIYAVGDAIEVEQYGSGLQAIIPLAGPANRQGRMAAENIFGHQNQYTGTQGTSVCKVFDLTVASVGLNEKILSKNNIAYEKIYVHPMNHAGYYPGATKISFKLIFDPQSGKILGAQGVGQKAVERRIDVIAVAIRANMTVFDLEHFELSYAPPYGSAKDVVNQAGMVASNVVRGDSKVCHGNIVHQCSDNMLIVDVRNPEEIGAIGAIEHSINIPLPELRDRLDELPKDKNIVVYCAVGLRGYVGEQLLKHNGFNVKNLSGGFTTYRMMKPTITFS